MRPLEPGDTIALVAPASWCDWVEETAAALRSRGFHVRLASNLDKKHSNFAGTDEERANALMEMWRAPEVKALWSIRGGYGSGRILERLDYEFIKAHPKIFIGMSDITALHTALIQECDMMTFLGPVARFLFHPETHSKLNEERMWEQIMRGSKVKLLGQETISSGVGMGRLVGGNLALICAHIGTPWQLKTEGKVLLLEDVDEYGYRIDRMLHQMEQAGMLDNLAGLILASWKGCKPGREGDWPVEKVLKNIFQGAPYPVILGFPSGHIAEQATLPLNCLVQLDGDRRELAILEQGVASELHKQK